MCRIIDVEEPAVQIFVTDISALSVVKHDRYQREQSAVLIRERSKTIILRQPDRRLQHE